MLSSTKILMLIIADHNHDIGIESSSSFWRSLAMASMQPLHLAHFTSAVSCSSPGLSG